MFDVWQNKFSYDQFMAKYSRDGKENWRQCVNRVADAVGYGKIKPLMYDRKFIPAGRYLYAAGRPFHQVNNCFLFRAEDSREGWADATHKATMALMTGGGIGIDYSAVRAEGAPISKTGGQATGPISLMQMVNECGRHIMQGGQRRSAIWAGLSWDHPDIEKFIRLKDWPEEWVRLKADDLTYPMPMELTNISVIYDTLFFDALEGGLDWLVPGSEGRATETWLENCRQAFKTAEPGMSFNYGRDDESLRNACCEVTSSDDSDKCNLGTLWINRFANIDDFAKAVRHATRFLLHGGIYSHLPTDKIRHVGEGNNRIGLGLGGIHEWLMVRGYDYEVTAELHDWLRVYEEVSDEEAYKYSRKLGVAEPKGKRAIAPNGTIGIIAETTTGIEPLFCKAYKRRYFKDGVWKHQFVVDGSVKRLMELGVSPERIQDSYDLSFEQRVKFQADVQDYVDMAISSTCNMPAWGSNANNESNVKEKADILLKYAKRLRGFTCYPDGCRTGQPLTRCDLSEALAKEGTVFEERENECVGGVCGL